MNWRLLLQAHSPRYRQVAIVAYLNSRVNDIIASPSYRQKIEALGMTLPVSAENTPEKFKAFMISAAAKQAELAKLSGHRKQWSQGKQR